MRYIIQQIFDVDKKKIKNIQKKISKTLDNIKYTVYNKTIKGRREANRMARRKKSGGNQDRELHTVILITAVLRMVKSLIDLIRDLT